jgi:hypothetical protein
MLVAEEVDGFQSCSLNCIHYPITYHINFDRLPLGAKGMLRNSHFDSTSADTFFLILHCIIWWGLGIKERA